MERQKFDAQRRHHAQLERLHSAAKSGNNALVMNVLQAGCVDINRPGPEGMTALYHAVRAQREQVVRTLLAHGADANASSFVSQYRDPSSRQLRSCDEYPLVAAARLHNHCLVRLLLENGADPNKQVSYYSDHISGACLDRSALHFAAQQADVDMVDDLLNHGASATLKDKQQESALHLAARCKSCSNHGRILQLLCERGAPLNDVNKLDCSALYLSAFYGCLLKVQVLLAAGADVNQCSQQESAYGSALHIAAVKDRHELAEVLISHGAVLSLPNGQGYTPLLANINAHSRSDIARVLICQGASLQVVDNRGYTVLGSCIRNMRLDCESLSQLLVFAGYNFQQDRWLCPAAQCPHPEEEDKDEDKEEDDDDDDDDPEQCISMPIPQGRVQRLCDWLRSMRHNPHTLADLCRIRVRRLLSNSVKGRAIEVPTSRLPLPRTLRDFIMLKDVHYT